jgi:hypothetical protein
LWDATVPLSAGELGGVGIATGVVDAAATPAFAIDF